MVTLCCPTCKREFLTYQSNNRVYCSRECIPPTVHEKHGHSRTRLYGIWSNMKTRCLCTTCKAYPRYGGRGITVCTAWLRDFAVFRDWAIAHGYTDQLELDRKNTDGNYCPENCRWANRRQQMRNTRKRRNAKTSVYKGVSWCAGSAKWRVQLCRPGHSPHIGLFDDEIAAARAYDAAARKHFGEYAHLNF